MLRPPTSPRPIEEATFASSAELLDDDSLYDAWQEIIDTISERATDSQVDVHLRIESVLEKLLDTEHDVVPGLVAIARNALQVSDDEMQVALSLDNISGPIDPLRNAPPTTTRFYFRSLGLQAQELQQVLTVYRARYHDQEFSDHLQSLLQPLPPTESVWIRYVGCSAATSPWARYIQDINGVTRFANFHKVLVQEFPEKSFVVHHCKKLNVPANPAVDYQQEIDGMERILIHLFGRHALLNSQPGGFYQSYKPSPDDAALVQSLDVPAAQEFFVNTLALPDHHQHRVNMTCAIKQAYESLGAELQARGGASAEAAALFTDEHIELLGEQASQGHVVDHEGTACTPFLLLGRDMTVQDYNLRRKYSDGSASGQAVAMMFQLLLSLPDTKNVSFCDVWPIPWKRLSDDLDLFSAAAAYIMQLLKSIIVATMGYEPTALAFSGFRDRHSLNPAEYGDVIGEPLLANIDHGFDYESHPLGAEPECGWVIVIPHMHPGSSRYSSTSPVLLRLAYLTWVRTFLLFDCCLSTLRFHHACLLPGSKPFAEHVLRSLREREAAVDFAACINQARIDARQWRSEDAAKRRAKSILRGVTQYGFTSESGTVAQQDQWPRYGYAQGAPHSADREAQVKRLEPLGLAMFRRQPSYNQDRAGWREWFLSLSQGTNLVRAAGRNIQLTSHQPFGSLSLAEADFLKTQRVEGYEPGDYSWITDSVVVATVKRNWALKMKASRTPMSADAFARAQALRTLKRFGKQRQYHSLFLMVRCYVNRNGRAALMLQRKDGSLFSVPNGLYVGCDMCLQEQEIFIDYDPAIDRHALVIKDADGALLPDPQEPKKLTDVWLKAKHPEVFQVFCDTVHFLGECIRPDLSGDASLSLERIVPFFFRQHCLLSDLLLTTLDYAPNHNVPTFRDLMNETLDRHGTDAEKCVWGGLIKDRNYCKIKKVFDSVQKSADMDRNNKLWMIPQYHDPAIDASQPPPPPPAITKRKVYTISDAAPFFAWWRSFHRHDPPGSIVTVDYKIHEVGFWGEFQHIIDLYGADHESIKPYVNCRDDSVPQSVNNLFKKAQWGWQGAKGVWQASVPASSQYEAALVKMKRSIRTEILETESSKRKGECADNADREDKKKKQKA